MVDGLTGRVLDSSRSVPYQPPYQPPEIRRADPTLERAAAGSAFSAVVVLGVVAAAVGRRRSPARVGRKQRRVLAVFLGAGVVVLAVRRPVVAAYRDHRYDARWSRQPLGW